MHIITLKYTLSIDYIVRNFTSMIEARVKPLFMTELEAEAQRQRNLATAPTVGTSVPALTIPIAASSVTNVQFGTTGIRFTTGISLAITGEVADSDTTAVAANEVKSAITYI